MAGLNPQFGVVAGRGAVLIGAKGATAPTLTALTTFAGNPTQFPAGFAPFGVTHPDELPEYERDGGDEKQLFVWEYAAPVASFREDEPVNSFTVNGLEFANDTMRLYEGGGDATGAGIFWAPTNPVPTEASALGAGTTEAGAVGALEYWLLARDGRRYDFTASRRLSLPPRAAWPAAQARCRSGSCMTRRRRASARNGSRAAPARWR